MNIQQFFYISAIEECGSFVEAAQKCFVTQSTLSIMVKKLEEELGFEIFDRTTQPLTTTDLGRKIIRQSRIILQEIDELKMLVAEEKDGMSGHHSIAIIPTLAPYLLPLFIDDFLKKHPGLTLSIHELTTEIIVQKLESRELDIGILAIPNHIPSLNELSLFKEEFVVYAPDKNHYKQKKYLIPSDIDPNKLWLLDEGHCLRNQVINLCELKEKERKNHPLDFSAGSIETLKRMVEINQGVTILPFLALDFLTEKESSHIYYFEKPAPVREIGLVTHKHFSKSKLLYALKDEILHKIPGSLQKDC